jgi:single stranded DNA-binding protein
LDAWGRIPRHAALPRAARCARSVSRWTSGESKKTTDWFNLEAWGKLGDICNKYLKKGRLVYVEGRVKTDKYESAGETRYFTKVIVANLQLLDKKIVDAEEEAIASEEAEE